jgi:hypothetical protein
MGAETLMPDRPVAVGCYYFTRLKEPKAAMPGSWTVAHYLGVHGLSGQFREHAQCIGIEQPLPLDAFEPLWLPIGTGPPQRFWVRFKGHKKWQMAMLVGSPSMPVRVWGVNGNPDSFYRVDEFEPGWVPVQAPPEL